MNTYSVQPKGPNVLIVRFDDIAAGWEQWLLLSSDRHHDNKHCNRSLERRHLERAKELGALIIDAGDLFCAMQGKYDPRSSMDDIRPEDVRQDYLDSIVIHAASDYAPYAENWLLIGRGNHETNIRKRHGTDLISNLVHRMNTEYGARTFSGGYGGWVRFLFKSSTKRRSMNLKYFHGSGGDSPVTKGVIKTNRQAVYLPDADIVLNGHNHNAYHVPLPRERLTQKGDVKRDVVDFIRTPGYKDEYNDGAGGFLVEGGNGPKPLGCAWVRLWWDATNSQIEREISLDAS